MDENKTVNLNLDISSWEIIKALPAQTREAYVLFAIKNSSNSEFYKTMSAKTVEQIAEVPTNNTPTITKTSVSWDSF